MKNFATIEKTLKTIEPLLKKRFKVKRIGIFGSFIKGEQRKKSDIDILVEFQESVGLFEFMDLAEFLENSLGLKVDLVTKNALKPLLKNTILREVVYL